MSQLATVTSFFPFALEWQALTPFGRNITFSVVVSFFFCACIVLTGRWHQRFTADYMAGVQKVHEGQVPRIGGLALALALALASQPILDTSAHAKLTLLLYAALPAFLFGLIEDCTHKVPVFFRLWATIFAGTLGCFLLQTSITAIGIGWIDSLLAITLISFAFTSFATAGLASSINLIDGLNGLAATVSIVIFAALAVLADQVGDQKLCQSSLIIAVVVLGFWFINWPWGKLFLGDGGAYLLGFLMAWIAILLTARNPELSPFAMLLICAYPIIETLSSIVRRVLFKKRMGQADQQHLHHLVLFHVKYAMHVPLRWANPVAGLLASLICIPPIVLALLMPTKPIALMLSFVLMCLAYSALYVSLKRSARRIANQGDLPSHANENRNENGNGNGNENKGRDADRVVAPRHDASV
jgi:UDP-N-acetylmuramyl pentapeptide phosphotransferase/UDP-N-acetylglucosamine-1-phosphate transferase